MKATEKIYNCGLCGIAFANYKRLLFHCKRHNGEREFKCKFGACGKEFVTKTQLRKHQLVHLGVKVKKITYYSSYKCAKPRKQLAKKFELVLHNEDHIEREDRKKDADSEQHLSIEEFVRLRRDKTIPATTDQDQGKFKTKAICTSEERILVKTLVEMEATNCKQKSIRPSIYSGVKPFRCDTCNEAFIHRAELWEHKKCHVSAGQAQQLKQNYNEIQADPTRLFVGSEIVSVRIGKPEFQCQVCNACFGNHGLFQSHIAVHLNNRKNWIRPIKL